MPTTTKHPCPSCRDGAGPVGIYSPRPPVCMECYGTKEVLRCDVCGRIVGSEGCEHCDSDETEYAPGDCWVCVCGAKVRGGTTGICSKCGADWYYQPNSQIDR